MSEEPPVEVRPPLVLAEPPALAVEVQLKTETDQDMQNPAVPDVVATASRPSWQHFQSGRQVHVTSVVHGEVGIGTSAGMPPVCTLVRS